MNNVPDPKQIWWYCISCARRVYGKTPPPDDYALSVALQMFGILAQESNFKYQRQLGFSKTSPRGAFGLCQCELGSIADSLDALRNNPLLRGNAQSYLLQYQYTFDPYKVSPLDVAFILEENTCDALDVLFARLHLMRIPKSVPAKISLQAADWKEYYNTPAGAGTVTEYMNNFRSLCAPVLDSLGVRYEI